MKVKKKSNVELEGVGGETTTVPSNNTKMVGPFSHRVSYLALPGTKTHKKKKMPSSSTFFSSFFCYFSLISFMLLLLLLLRGLLRRRPRLDNTLYFLVLKVFFTRNEMKFWKSVFETCL